MTNSRTSSAHEQALSLGIPLLDMDSQPVVNLVVDDTDEVDYYLNLVNECSGTLLKEKMVEGACKKFVIIVDESKLINYVGGSNLAMSVKIIKYKKQKIIIDWDYSILAKLQPT
ncbi:hypothetical protein HN51_014149 [Arachis hypogaea]